MKKSFILFFMMTFVWSGIAFSQNISLEEKIAIDQNTEVDQPGMTGSFIDLPETGNKAVLLSESFDTQIPADWTQTVYSGTGTWEWTGGLAEANSDANTADIFDVGLFTSPIDFTGEIMGSITLWHNLQDYAGDGAGAINVYSGGMAASNLETQLFYTSSDMTTGGLTQSFGFDPSSFADPSQVYFEFWYSTEGGTWAWYYKIDDIVIEAIQPKVEVTPTAIDLGEWPIGGWQEAQYLTIENTGAGTAALNGSELDDPDGVFALMNPSLPFTLPADGTQAMVGVSFDSETAMDGPYTATYVASWGAGKSVTTADIAATAYTAVEGDIVENPFMVTIPHMDAGVSTALPMRSNYMIPGTATNGKDVVYMFTLDEDKELDIVLSNATETPKMAIYAAGFEGEGGPMLGNAVASAGSTAMDLPLFAGDYYLVVMAESDDAAMTFDIDISATTMPEPECIMNPMPADGTPEIPSNGIVLSWEYGNYTQEYQLLFGTEYPPTEELMGWTAIDPMGDSYALPNLDPSMQYFWQVNVKNNNVTVACDIYGFTTTLTPPSNLMATVVQIQEDEYNVDLSWTASAKALLGYNVYRDAVMINTSLVTTNSYTDLDLPYNMNPCYEYTVEAVFDEGISELSNTASACITGVGTVDGNVSALITGNPINGALVNIASETGGQTYDLDTDLAGNYSGEVLEDTYTYTVSKDGFITEVRTGISISYNTTTTEDFLLDEFPFPVNSVIAIATEDDQAVDVYWNSPGVENTGGLVDEDFTGGMPSWFVADAPEADWHVTNNMLTLTTGGADVWRSGYMDEVLTDAIYQVSQQRNTGSDGGSMGVYVRGNGFADMNPGSGASGNMFCWTTNGYWWTGTLTNGDLPDWSGWMTTTATNTGLGQPNVITSEIIGSTVTFLINNVSITSMTTANAEGYVGGFAHESTVSSEMAFDYWQVIPGGMGKNAIVLDEKQYEGKGSPEECLSAAIPSSPVEVKGLAWDTRPSENDKDLNGYMVYRQVCNEATPAEFLGMTLDTNFRDNTWNTVDWGMYKWGVEAAYDNNNSEMMYSNCLDKDMLTTVGVEVTTNSGDSPEGTYVLFTNTSEPDLELFYETDLDATGMYSWDPFRKGVYDIYVQLDGFGEIMLSDVAIETDTIFIWQFEELLAPPTDLYVTPTGFATWTGGGSIPFEPYFENFDSQDQFDMWEVVHNGSSAQTWYWTMSSNNGNSLDGTGFAYVDADAGGSGVSMDEQLISPVIDASNAEELIIEFDIVHQQIGDVLNIDVWDGDAWINVGVSDGDSGPYPWGPTAHMMFDATEYANADFRLRFHYIAGWDWFVGIDNVSVHDNSGKYAGKAFQFFKIWHDGVFSNDVDTNFYQYGTNPDVDILVPGETYLAEVAALYSTGLSEKSFYEWTYLPCDSFPSFGFYDAYNIDGSDDNVVLWTDMQAAPEDYLEGFEGSFPPDGWMKANPDGGTGWEALASGTAPLPGWNGGEATSCPDGGSQMAFATYTTGGASGNDQWLISPELSAFTDYVLSFYMDVQYADSYTENVDVLISTTGTDEADFTVVVEEMTFNSADGWILYTYDITGLGLVESGAPFYVAFREHVADNWNDGAAVMLDNFYYGTPSKKAQPESIATTSVGGRDLNYVHEPTPDAVYKYIDLKNMKNGYDVIGANIYRDGEMIAYVPMPDTFYLDMNLEAGYYDYCVAKVYTADEGAHSWTSCEGSSCVEDVLVPEDCLAPENLTAESLIGDGYTATLNWNAPNGFDPVWLQYDDGVNVDGIGGPTEFTYASKWDPSQLADFDGTAVTKVKFFPREVGTSFTLKIWKGANAGTLIHEQPLSGITYDDWNEIDLSSTVAIDNTEELWIGFYVVTSGYPAGCGNYTGNSNSDYITLDGVAWEHLADYGLNYSWNLGAYVEAAKGEIVELPSLVDHATYNSTSTEIVAGNLGQTETAVDPFNATALLSYNVYRDGEMIASDIVETTYADEIGEPGQFCYEVTAVYSVCGESDPSNEACVTIVGINDVNNTIAVYPNPATDFVMVEASSDIRSIEITNYMGQVVEAFKSLETTQYKINSSSFSAGIYFVEIETNAGIEKVRIVISE